MIKVALLLIVGVIARQAYCDEPEAIVGGDIAEVGQFKYQVSLLVYGEHMCGGSIIDSRHVLTAAHCVDDEYISDMVVVSGTNMPAVGGQKHEIECVRRHPGYTGEKEDGWKDDIAVITLKTAIVRNVLQGPIPLASKNHVDGTKRGIVSGWGKTDVHKPPSPLLKWLAVNIVSQERCLSGHKNPRTNENHICTLERAGKGACQGDSGGPLVVDGELVGVVSWVIPCAWGVSDVYTSVYKYLDFIKESQSMTC